ncbi:hypothetical protein, partial [Bacteroides fragilis]|uniref:hypothetical protein n=1 Tax=Bacteroides fragilis TaxID=817 RepID=UPI003C2B7C42
MQTAEVAIAPVIKVILKTDAKALDEVVVTAMGIPKEKKALRSAVQDFNRLLSTPYAPPDPLTFSPRSPHSATSHQPANPNP